MSDRKTNRKTGNKQRFSKSENNAQQFSWRDTCQEHPEMTLISTYYPDLDLEITKCPIGYCDQPNARMSEHHMYKKKRRAEERAKQLAAQLPFPEVPIPTPEELAANPSS